MTDHAVITKDAMVSQNVAARFSSSTKRSTINITHSKINSMISGVAGEN
jgi:hypothetical protein